MSHPSPFANEELLERIVARLTALADPARLRILNHLRTHGECTIGALVEVVGLSQPSVSRHVSVLRREGLIGSRREGNQMFCSLCDDSVFSICNILCEGVVEQVRSTHSALSVRPSKSSGRRPSPRSARA